MNISAFQANHGYNLAKSALKTDNAAPKPGGDAGASSIANPSEPNGAFKAMHEVASTITQGEKAAMNYMTGSADPHSVVEAIAAAELAVETAVTVRDKVVEAYQELIRMPV